MTPESTARRLAMPIGELRRSAIVAAARRWVGTPYHHQASCRAVGVDCIGLIRGVWREVCGAEPERPPGYGPDWAEATAEETLLQAARRHFVEVPPAEARSGDVIVFRFRPGLTAKHAAILVGLTHETALPTGTDRAASARLGDLTQRFTFIHAAERAPVCEVPLAGWWRRRIAGTFQFPGVID
jgi:NlpC/P60 family putative phage cell wall peptidase